jgi:hypothetical protein
MTDLEILKDPRKSVMSLADALKNLAEAWPSLSPRERAINLWAIGQAMKVLVVWASNEAVKDQEKKAGKA